MRWLLTVALLAACGTRSERPVEKLAGTEDVSGFALRTLQGTRDGERVDVRAVYGDASRSLRVEMRFRVSPQARLEAGKWTGLRGEGDVKERAVTFLGGQSGPPSIGGRFDLLGPDGAALYRISIPLQQLKQPL